MNPVVFQNAAGYNAVLRHSKLLGLSWQRDTGARARLRDPNWTP